MVKIKLNGQIEKFDSLEKIECSMEKTSREIFRKDDYITLLKNRIVDLESEKKQLYFHFESLDNMRGNFEENYQLIK